MTKNVKFKIPNCLSVLDPTKHTASRHSKNGGFEMCSYFFDLITTKRVDMGLIKIADSAETYNKRIHAPHSVVHLPISENEYQFLNALSEGKL